MASNSSKVLMTQLLSGSHLDSGELSVSQLLVWMDLAACMSAEKLAKRNCVTAAMDQVHIIQLPNQHDIVTIAAQVNRAFKTSMEVGVKVSAENRLNGIKRHCCSAYFTFVSIVNGKTSEIVITNDEQQSIEQNKVESEAEKLNDLRRFSEANERKKIRIAKKELIEKANQELLINKELSEFKQENVEQLKKAATSFTMKTELILPLHANHMGSMFGGVSMSWIEDAARIAASRFAQVPVKLECIEDLQFLCPMKVGDRVIVRAQVNRTFDQGSCLEIGVRVDRLLLNGIVEHSLSAFLSYQTQKRESFYLQVLPETEDEKTWFRQALGRRRLRFIRQTIRNDDSFSHPFNEETKLELIYNNIRGLLLVNNNEVVCPELWSPVVSLRNVNFEYQTLSNRITIIRGTFSLPLEPHVVAAFLLDLSKRSQWDMLLNSAKILESIDENNDIVEFFYDSSPKLVSLILLRSWRELENSNSPVHIISNRSISHSKYPESSEFLRAEILQSGYIIKSNDSGGSDIVYLLQLGPKALSLAIEDLVGASAKPMISSIINLISIFEKQCTE